MREPDRAAFEPLLPPRRGEVLTFADRAAHFLGVTFVMAIELNEKKPAAERFTAEEYVGPVARTYACSWTITACNNLGFPRLTEKLMVLSRVFEKVLRKGPVAAAVLADDAYRRFLQAGTALKERIETIGFSADDPLAAETLEFHAAGRALEGASRLAEEVADGAEWEVIGPEIVALEELLVAARRFASAS